MRIINTKTNQAADPKLAAKEPWASNLATQDIQGFAVTQDGAVILMDECGAYAMTPAGEYDVVPDTAEVKVSNGPLTAKELFQIVDAGKRGNEDIWLWLEILDPKKFEFHYSPFSDKPGYVIVTRQWMNSNGGVAIWSGGHGMIVMVKDMGTVWNLYRQKPNSVMAAISKPAPAPEPLSKDYLKFLMEKVKAHLDKEWVWIEPIGEGKSIHAWHAEPIEAGYYRAQNDYTDEEGFCCGWPGVGYCFEFDEMGVTWNAYHTKPE